MSVKKENIIKDSSLETKTNYYRNKILKKKCLKAQINEMKIKIQIEKIKQKLNIQNQKNFLKLKKEFLTFFEVYLKIKNFTKADSLKILNKKILEKQIIFQSLEKKELLLAKNLIKKIIKNGKIEKKKRSIKSKS